MKVADRELLTGEDKNVRARICERKDGFFVFVIERAIFDDEDDFWYWTNDHPASGIFGTEAEARRTLKSKLKGDLTCQSLRPCEYDPTIGPYPIRKLAISPAIIKDRGLFRSC